MASVMLATLVAIAIFWSGWVAHRLWIGPTIERYRHRQDVNRLGVRAFIFF